MKIHSPSLVVVLVASVAASLTPLSSAAGDALSEGALSESELRKLHRQLLPSETEPWRTIPWKISLLEAQRSAATEKKPIFIWAMDGHPLGCT